MAGASRHLVTVALQQLSALDLLVMTCFLPMTWGSVGIVVGPKFALPQRLVIEQLTIALAENSHPDSRGSGRKTCRPP
jgi:hypothetical protein